MRGCRERGNGGLIVGGDNSVSTAIYQRRRNFTDDGTSQPLLPNSHTPFPTPSRRSNSPEDKAKIKCLICELVGLANLISNIGDYYI
jgi:hypothetical protein